ncbi:transmembrane protein, putative [Medicago truncatula]|uniref:Transmembrane protein, putative n=1 Tax=Medicago truncatula TaxID=3880 RepID=G7IUF6_MEDTR|nr:transmembrane protein, putative [Medicago truncatula]
MSKAKAMQNPKARRTCKTERRDSMIAAQYMLLQETKTMFPSLKFHQQQHLLLRIKCHNILKKQWFLPSLFQSILLTALAALTGRKSYLSLQFLSPTQRRSYFRMMVHVKELKLGSNPGPCIFYVSSDT